MYCPNCGQQQVSSNLRFCSRCGFPLGLVAEVLANGGSLPQLATLENKKKLLTRRNVFIFGLAWFVILTMILTPVAGILFDDMDWLADRVVPLFAIFGSIGGLMIMLFSLFFESSRARFTPLHSAHSFAGFNNQLGGSAAANALPPQSANFNPVNNAYVPPTQQQAVPTKPDWREANTNELVMPPSVTEDTTRMLEKQ